MKRAHVLRTALAVSDCRSLWTAAAELGERIGWLNLESVASATGELEEAAASGVFRAVGVSAGRVAAVKPVRGPVVVEDLVREYFSGCRLVLVRGTLDAPELLKTDSGYAVRFVDGTRKSFTAEALARALRAPRLRRMTEPGPRGSERSAIG